MERDQLILGCDYSSLGLVLIVWSGEDLSEKANSKIDEVLKVIEDIERVSQSGFGSKEKQMLAEKLLRRARDSRGKTLNSQQ